MADKARETVSKRLAMRDYLATELMGWRLKKGGPSAYNGSAPMSSFPDEWVDDKGFFVMYRSNWIPDIDLNQARDCVFALSCKGPDIEVTLPTAIQICEDVVKSHEGRSK